MLYIDGRKIAADILESLKKRVNDLNFTPIFCDIMIGNDPVSESYVNLKAKRAQEIGINFLKERLISEVTTELVVSKVNELNLRKNLCGLIVQLPLPQHIDTKAVINAINPRIDVDCLTPRNRARFYGEDSIYLTPPTAAAVMEILQKLPIVLNNQTIAVIGQGDLVGRPVTESLRKLPVRVLTADKETGDISYITKQADIIISATGKPALITADMVKKNVVLIDAGTSESSGGIVGDIDKKAYEKASFVSPVPGGVGPVTVGKLLENVVTVAERQKMFS
jgi:methylenetetrahydrofolate dehydrogenase (NADP+)/methenyltetrahydrofolate cyclohydrolase